MGVLVPALLALGAAAVVPVLLHLFQRHQGPRVVFPALRYLRRAEKESARQIRLRQLFLLLLRVAVVLLLATAAARPFLRAGGVGHEPTAVAIILDTSLSTGAVVGDGRMLDELKARALQTLDRAGPDDRFWLIRAGAPWEPALPGDAETTARRVREAEPTAAASDLLKAVAQARALLDAGGGGRATEIHLLSDLQATGLGSAAAVEPGGPPLLVWVSRTQPPPNAWVESVEVAGGIAPVAGERTVVAVRVAGATADSLPVRLVVDGRVVAAGVAPPGVAAVLTLPARAAGVLTGRVEKDPDALRADDRRYFALRVLPAPQVGLTGRLPFVEAAIGVMEGAGRVRRVAPALADVVLLPAAAGIEALPPDRSAVVLPPDSPLELPAANRRLAAAGVPWRYGPPGGTGEGRFETGAAALGGDELGRTLEGVRLFRVHPLLGEPGTAADTLLSLQDGTAWAVRGERGGGRYILLGSALSETASTLPTSAAMVPFLDRLIGTWIAPGVAPAGHEPGDEVVLPPGTTAVERPDGTVESAAGGSVYRLGGEPGVYHVLAGDEVAAAWAVNPAPGESRLERMDRRTLRGALPGADITFIDTPGGWAGAIYTRRLGREIGGPLLGLALALLILEAAVAASGGRRGATATAAPAPEPAGD
jgi:hypothetical protein